MSVFSFKSFFNVAFVNFKEEKLICQFIFFSQVKNDDGQDKQNENGLDSELQINTCGLSKTKLSTI